MPAPSTPDESVIHDGDTIEPLAPAASNASLKAAVELMSSSGRRIDTPVRKAFVRNRIEGGRPPMATLYSGGQGGMVALKLYLALIWRCSASPYQTDKPARAWATLLNLDDPEGKGARRVAHALRKLEKHQLVHLTHQPAKPTLVTLLDESGDGREYDLPSTAYAKAKRGKRAKAEIDHHLYFKVSSRLWLTGQLQRLKGPGLVMLLILLTERGGEGDEVWFSTTAFKERYAISSQTRADGTSELLKAGLLTIEKRSLAHERRATTYDVRRQRNVYKLFGAALTD